MARISASRDIPATAEEIWRLIADPHNLPRWWPETVRVEGVEGDPGAKRGRFTQVMTTSKGASVRADFRCTEATRNERLLWEQQIDGTPFEKFLTSAALELLVENRDGGESRMTIVGHRKLKGLSRLGSPMMSGATKRILEEALAGLETALVGSAGTTDGDAA